MLSFIHETDHPLLAYVKDDPVRPDIPVEFRVTDNRFISTIVKEKPLAMVCVSLHNFVPTSVEDLNNTTADADTAIFYTIWSYQPGAGADLLIQTVKEIQQKFPHIKKFVTLSPKTEMARRFHLKNGARVFRENLDTINYEYHQL